MRNRLRDANRYSEALRDTLPSTARLAFSLEEPGFPFASGDCLITRATFQQQILGLLRRRRFGLIGAGASQNGYRSPRTATSRPSLLGPWSRHEARKAMQRSWVSRTGLWASGASRTAHRN